MTEYIAEQMDEVFHALADATRRDILKRIAREPCTVSKIAEPYAMSLNAISKHLKVLEKADLVKRMKKGREYYFIFNQKSLDKAIQLMANLQQYWAARLDALEDYFKSQNIGETS